MTKQIVKEHFYRKPTYWNAVYLKKVRRNFDNDICMQMGMQIGILKIGNTYKQISYKEYLRLFREKFKLKLKEV